MPKLRKISDEQARLRWARGWVFRKHTREESEAINKWIQTGEITEHLPEFYKKLTKDDINSVKY